MRVRYEGQIHEFPDGTSDDEISAALESYEATPAQQDRFADRRPLRSNLANAGWPEATPIEVELPDGSIAEFPDTMSMEAVKAAVQRKFPPKAASAKPSVPTYVRDAAGNETVLDAGQLAQLQAQQKAERDAADAAFAETRTPGRRVADTAAFAASAPVRALTRGEYGAGDVAQAAGLESIARALSGSEQNFARANQAALETAAALGEVGAGIPVLSTMGAIPGQMTRSIAANLSAPIRGARQGVGEVASAYAPPAGSVRRLLREEAGSGPLPGGGGGPVPPGSPPVPPAAPGAPAAARGAQPTRNEIIAAGERLNALLPEGERYNLTPNMIVSGEMAQGVAGGLQAIPYAGGPVAQAFDRGLFGMGQVAESQVRRLGTPGAHHAGQGLKEAAENWISGRSADELAGLYDEVDQLIRPNVTVNLAALKSTVGQIATERKRSTSRAADSAVGLVWQAINRPEGLTVEGLKQLRTDIGARLSGSITPEPGTSQPALKRLYAALSEDLKSAIGVAAKPGQKRRAQEAFERANSRAAEVAQQREELTRIIGKSGDLSAERVVERLAQMAGGRGGDLDRLRTLRQTVIDAGSEQAWGDFAATLAARLGRNPKTDEFSAGRFLTAYNRFSDAGKNVVFGEVREALDDLALIAGRFDDLQGKFNTSGTGRVNAILKLLLHPHTALGGVAGAAVSPMSLLVTAGSLSGMQTGRSVAWSLARPAVARETAKVFRALYRAERATREGTEAIARREAGLSNVIRSYSLALAQETGGNPIEIHRAISAEIDRIRSADSPKK